MVEDTVVTDTVETNDQAAEQAPETKVETPEVSNREVFDKIAEKHGKKASDEKAPKPEAKVEAPAKAEAPKAEPEQPSVDPETRERALRAIRRANAPTSVLDQLDDQALIKWGLELADTQKEVDRRLSLSQARASEDPATAVMAEPASAGRPESSSTEFDFGKLAASLEDHLGLDEDGTKALASSYSAVASAVRDQVMQSIAPFLGALDQLAVNETLRGFEDRYPELADNAQRQAVRAKMQTLHATGEYGDLPSVASDAIRLLFDHRPEKPGKSRNLDLERKRDAGSAHATSIRPKTPTTPEERNKARFFKIAAEKEML